MVTKAKSKARREAPVTWRDGIHLTGTSIWCDAIRARDICFLSSASAMRGAKHAQLIASQDCLQLLGPQERQEGSRLPVPFGQPFTLGKSRIELFSSGHGLGASSLLVHVDGTKVVYAGRINPRGSALGGKLDHRSADILVVSARYGSTDAVFPEASEIQDRLFARARDVASAGGIAVLLVRDAEKAVDLASLLGPDDVVWAHRGFHDAAKRARPKLFGALRRWTSSAKGGGILLWPMDTRAKLDVATLPKGSARFLVSGQAADPDAMNEAGASEGFVLSNQADHNDLVRYIRSSGARQVYLTQSSDRGAGLKTALPNIHVESIGPPEQLSLFEA